MLWLHSDYHCDGVVTILVPAIVTTCQWLHFTHGTRYLHSHWDWCGFGYQALQLHHHYMVATRYAITQSLCRNQGSTDIRFRSPWLVPQACQRMVTTSLQSDYMRRLPKYTQSPITQWLMATTALVEPLQSAHCTRIIHHEHESLFNYCKTSINFAGSLL